MNKLTAEKCKTLITNMHGEWEESGLSTKEELYLAALEIALQVLERKGGWTSCSERMPVQYQSNRYVPLTLLLNERTVAQGGFDDGQFWIDGVVVHNVTRWQPMPLPPSTTPQIDNDVWIEWGGGKQPIANDRELAIKFRDGTVMTETHSDCWVWSHGGDDDDIIAYRVIENDGREG